MLPVGARLNGYGTRAGHRNAQDDQTVRQRAIRSADGNRVAEDGTGYQSSAGGKMVPVIAEVRWSLRL